MYLERYQQLISDNTNSNDDKELTVDTVVLPDGEEKEATELVDRRSAVVAR